jgi:hypothetical protein
LRGLLVHGPSEIHGCLTLLSVRPFAAFPACPGFVGVQAILFRRCRQLSPRLCRRPSHPLPGFFTASADCSLRSSGDARRPFRRKASSPQVRVVNVPAQPLDIRRHPLVVRASRTDARSPWMASPLIHRTRFLWRECFLFVGSRFRYRFFQCRPHGRTGFPACHLANGSGSLRPAPPEDFHLLSTPMLGTHRVDPGADWPRAPHR